MSDSERETYTSTTLAYTCRDCGGAMRTSGIDGRCIHCVEPPPVRCQHCGRVRHGAGQDWFDHPGSFAQEQPGQCRDCLEKRHQKAERLYRREFWAAQRRKATGRCRPTGKEPFEGMRGEDE